MREYFTEGIVLGVRPYGEADRWVDLYTKDFGRIGVKMTGGRKLLSKLSPHLDVMNLVEARLVQKNQFTFADVITKNRFNLLRKNISQHSSALRLVFLLRSLVPESVQDLQFWHYLVRSFSWARINHGIFLKLLGYDPLLARCENCLTGGVSYFSPGDQSFLCKRCCLRLSLSLDTLLYIHATRTTLVL